MPPGVILDTPVRLGQWETDWAKIRVFTTGGVPQVLFYRTSGEVFTVAIQISGTDLTPIGQRSPLIGTTTPGGTWETDWAEIAAFEVADLTFGFDRFDIINQKSDSDHADNDSLHLIWTITKAVTKAQTAYSKTISIPGILRSGDSVSGRFATDPFNLEAGDVSP